MKVYYFTVFAVILMALFNIFGFNTASSYVYTYVMGNPDATDALGNPVMPLNNFTNGTFYLKLGLIFGAIGITTAIINVFSNFSPTYAIKGVFLMGILLLLAGDLIWVLSQIWSTGQYWLFWIVFPFIAALVGGYLVAMIDYWEGSD